eukprot:maker-scaffold_23-snap-gene-5.1-mRNA-1 protein AED:0.09 eAED:0.09 QI:29/0.75/1/1/1/1/5/31/185
MALPQQRLKERELTDVQEIKSSQQRAIVKQLLDQYSETGLTEELLEEIIPKKSNLYIAKCEDHVNLVLNESNEPVFFNQRDGYYFPNLKILHQGGDFMPIITIDKGSIKYIINGANIMSPGIMKDFEKPLDADQPVEIRAEGKEFPLAVGYLKMSTTEIKEKNKGIGVEVLHVLGDGLWTLKKLD